MKVANARSLRQLFESCSFSVELRRRRAAKNRNRVIYPSFISRRMGQLLKNTESTDRAVLLSRGRGESGPEMSLFCSEKTNPTLANSSKVARHLRSQECDHLMMHYGGAAPYYRVRDDRHASTSFVPLGLPKHIHPFSLMNVQVANHFW